MNIDFTLLVQLLFPTFLRKPVFIALLNAFANAFKTQKEQYDAFVDKCNYDISHTGQTCFLRAVLNDAIDPYNRQIQIYNSPRADYAFVYAELEPKVSYFFAEQNAATTYVPSERICGNAVAPFTVKMQAGATPDHNKQAASLVEKHKLPGRNFIIIN